MLFVYGTFTHLDSSLFQTGAQKSSYTTIRYMNILYCQIKNDYDTIMHNHRHNINKKSRRHYLYLFLHDIVSYIKAFSNMLHSDVDSLRPSDVCMRQ